MSYRIEGKDIVISGFEEGIADSPYLGIADMRNMNIIANPSEASVNFKTQAMILPPTVSATAFTADATTDRITVGSTSGYYKGMAIVFNTIGTTVGITAGVVYYVGDISGNTFKVFANAYYAAAIIDPIDITVSGSGTLSSYTMGKPMHSCVDQGQAFGSSTSGIPTMSSYIVDINNHVWILLSYTGTGTLPFTAGTVIFLGNISSTATSGENSICVWNNYLFLFRNNATDIWNMNLQTAPSVAWTYGWAGFSPSTTSLYTRCLVGQDDAIYICNGDAVASILEVAGAVFNPATPATYTANPVALRLPLGEQATCLAELGTSLLVGGVKTFVYPWDRVSTSYNYPIVVPERYISLIVATQSNAFIFAGVRGRIYITNGANINSYKKLPDYVSGNIQPFYTTGGAGSVNNNTTPLGDATYWRNSLCFSYIGYSAESLSTLTTMVGVWGIDVDTNALRMLLKMSYDTYAGTIPVIVPDLQSAYSGGEGLFCGWIDGSGNVGIDNTIRTPYTNYESVIQTELLPLGTYLDPFTPSQIEWKTSAPLVSGESIRLSYRTNLSDAFTLITDATHTTGESSVVGSVSDVIQANFQKAQWVQLQIESKSTASSPSYARLTELRIRDWPSGKNA